MARPSRSRTCLTIGASGQVTGNTTPAGGALIMSDASTISISPANPPSKLGGVLDLGGKIRTFNIPMPASGADYGYILAAGLKNGTAELTGGPTIFTGSVMAGANLIVHSTNNGWQGNLAISGGDKDSTGRIVMDPATTLTFGTKVSAYVPGLVEGRLANAAGGGQQNNWTTANPANGNIRYNIYKGNNTTLDTAFNTDPKTANWQNQETWVYSGQVYVGGDGRISFGYSVDDNAMYYIRDNAGNWVGYGGAWHNTDGPVGTLLPTAAPNQPLVLSVGWHDFEARVSNGGGGAGGWYGVATVDATGIPRGVIGANDNTASNYFTGLDTAGSVFHYWGIGLAPYTGANEVVATGDATFALDSLSASNIVVNTGHLVAAANTTVTFNALPTQTLNFGGLELNGSLTINNTGRLGFGQLLDHNPASGRYTPRPAGHGRPGLQRRKHAEQLRSGRHQRLRRHGDRLHRRV